MRVGNREPGLGTRDSTGGHRRGHGGAALSSAALWLAALAALVLTVRDAPGRSRAPSPESPFPIPALLANPDSTAGAALFFGYNCVDCHGVDGAGAIGPSLADGRWRFGGSEQEVFRSIADGRPEGMPRWGPKIPPAQIRQLVAYVRSLGVGRDVTTENFSGKTVTTVGH